MMVEETQPCACVFMVFLAQRSCAIAITKKCVNMPRTFFYVLTYGSKICSVSSLGSFATGFAFLLLFLTSVKVTVDDLSPHYKVMGRPK